MGDGEAQGYVRSRVRVWARVKKEKSFYSRGISKASETTAALAGRRNRRRQVIAIEAGTRRRETQHN
jgi:hypothetical protein